MSTSEEQLNALATFTSNLLAAEEKSKVFTMEREGQVDGNNDDGDTAVQHLEDTNEENLKNGVDDSSKDKSVQNVTVKNDQKVDNVE